MPPVSSSSRLSRRYKGFDLRIVPRDVIHFGYEIQSLSGVLIRSPDGFRTERAAFAAACAFVDEVDRRMGLGPLGKARKT